MNRPEVPLYKKSRIIIGLVIALASALAAPLLAGFSTTVMVYTVLNTFLYGFGGIIPAAAGILLSVAAFGVYFGVPGAVIAALGYALPSVFIIRNLRWRIPFFKQIAMAIIAQIAGVLAALAAAYAFIGADIIGAIVETFRSMIDMLSPGFVDYILDMIYSIEDVPEAFTESQLINGVLTESRRAEYIDGYLNEISAVLRLTMPGMLLSASALTGILAAAWPAKMIDRKLPVEGAYIPMARWFTPWQISVGLIGMWVVTWLITLVGVNGGDVMQLTMQALLFITLRIQASISLERRLSPRVKPALRVLIIIGAQLILTRFVVYYGAFSALFGTTGAAAQIQLLRAARHGDNSDNTNDNNQN